MGIFSKFNNPFKEPREEAKEATTADKSGVRRRPKSTPEQEKYSLDESVHELALEFEPEFLAKGGENLVYVLPGRKDIVVKGSKKVMYDILAEHPGAGAHDAIEESEVLEKAEKSLEREKRLYDKLRETFGAAHIPPQRKYLMKVPVTGEILQEVEKERIRFVGKEIPHDIKEAWTHVAVQRKQELPQDRESPRASYPDVRFISQGLHRIPEHRMDYEFISEALLTGEYASDIRSEEFARFFGTKEIADLVHEMKKDESLKEAVKDFVEKAINFAEQTGEIIDLVGKDNVVFFKKNGKWTYKLLDPIFPFYERALESGREAFLNSRGMTMSDMKGTQNDDWNKIMQAAVFVRMINGLAKASGSGTYMDFLPPSLLESEMVTKRLLPRAEAA